MTVVWDVTYNRCRASLAIDWGTPNLKEDEVGNESVSNEAGSCLDESW